MLNEFNLWREKLAAGVEIADSFYKIHEKILPRKIDKIAFFGMGGSAIAGKIVKIFLDRECKIPAFVFDGPQIPEFIDTNTLAFVVSYSGNTWETKSALDGLVIKGILSIVVTHSGGEMATVAQNRNWPIALMPQSLTPRSALGNFLGFFLRMLDNLNFLNGKKIINELLLHLDKFSHKYEEIAYFKDFIELVKEKESFQIWGVSGDSDSVAYRITTQFNENSKIRAVFLGFPELNHNHLEGFAKTSEKPVVLVVSSGFLAPKLELSLENSTEIIAQNNALVYKMPLLGDTWTQQLFHMILWGDFASFYLAKARSVDPVPGNMISKLKERSSKRPK